MTSLRTKVAQALAKADGHDWSKLSNEGRCGKWLTMADAALAVPELAAALKLTVVKPLELTSGNRS